MPEKDARRQWKRRMRRGLSLPEGPAALSDRGKAALVPDKLVDHFSFRGGKRGQALAKESQHSSILHLHRQPTSAARFNLCRRFQRNSPEEPEENSSVSRLMEARQGDDPIGRLFLVPHSSQSLDCHSRLPGHPNNYPSCENPQ
ncbi:hypothetical protein BDV11DRAFT_209221 [Aspergillus similis]